MRKTHRRSWWPFNDEELLDLAQVVAPSLDQERLDDVPRQAIEVAQIFGAASDHLAGDFVQELLGVGNADALDQNHVNVLAERDQLPLDADAELGAVVVCYQVDDERQGLHDQILDGLADVVVGMRESRQPAEINVQSRQNVANRHGDSLVIDFYVVEVVLTQEHPQVVALGVEEGRRQIVQVAEL